MDCGEPLVCDVIKTHLVSLLPVIEGATQLNLVGPWTSVVEHKVMGDSLAMNSVELGYDSDFARFLSFSFGRAKIDIIELVLLSLFFAKDLIEDVKRLV